MMKRVLNLSALGLLILTTSCSEPTAPQAFEQSSTIIAANDYIDNYKDSVDTTFKNTYHLSAPIGWINDPNGFSEFNGKYHLFYQYHPYEAVWGPMHWGHQTTTDFIKWNHEDVAIAPDMDYDQNGCFSGTAFVENGVQYLYYTAVNEFQNQAVAYSYDGVTYKKLDELLLSGKDLPEGFSNNDFRDPKVFKKDNKYCMLVGNKNNSTGMKQIIMFTADNPLGPFKYANVIYSRNDLGGIFECPDLTTIDGKDILISSPQSIGSDYEYKFQNSDSCVYLVGNLSVNTNKFYQATGTDMEEFDKGFSFYAPQTMTTSDGRTMMVAWMRSWAEPNLTKEDLWCGAMTLPRELTLKDNHIYQAPAREINNYIKNTKTSENITVTDSVQILPEFKGRTSKITVDIKVDKLESGKCGIQLFKGDKYNTRIYYDANRGYLVFDRSRCGSMMDGQRFCKVEPIDGKIKLEIYLDVNSVEVFINNGYYTMTGTTFTPIGNDDVALFAEGCTGEFSNLTKSDIIV